MLVHRQIHLQPLGEFAGRGRAGPAAAAIEHIKTIESKTIEA